MSLLLLASLLFLAYLLLLAFLLLASVPAVANVPAGAGGSAVDVVLSCKSDFLDYQLIGLRLSDCMPTDYRLQDH